MKITTKPKEIRFSWPMWIVTIDSDSEHCYAMFNDYVCARRLGDELARTYSTVNVFEVWGTDQK
jgi:hypothetical protein